MAKDTYKATLTISGVKYTATGATPVEAIGNLQPKNIKGNKGVLLVEGNGSKRERIMMPQFMQRLFTPSRLVREITLKNFGLLFDL